MSAIKLVLTSSLPSSMISSSHFIVHFSQNGRFQVIPHDSPHVIKNQKTVTYPISPFFTIFISSFLPPKTILHRVREKKDHQLVVVLTRPLRSSDFHPFCRYADIVPLVVCLHDSKKTPYYCLYCFPPKKSVKTNLRYIYPGIEYVEIPNHEEANAKYQRMIYTLEEEFIYITKYRRRFQRVNRNMGVVPIYRLARVIASKLLKKLKLSNIEHLKRIVSFDPNKEDDEPVDEITESSYEKKLRKDIEELFVQTVESFRLRKHEVLELEWEPFSKEEKEKIGSHYLHYFTSKETKRKEEEEVKRSSQKYYYNPDIDAVFSQQKTDDDDDDVEEKRSGPYHRSLEGNRFESESYRKPMLFKDEFDYEQFLETKRNENTSRQRKESFGTESILDVEMQFKSIIRTIEKNCEHNIRKKMEIEIERLKKLYYAKEQKMRYQYQEKLGEKDREIRRLKGHIYRLNQKLEDSKRNQIDHSL